MKNTLNWHGEIINQGNIKNTTEGHGKNNEAILNHQWIELYVIIIYLIFDKREFIRKCQNIYWDPMWWP